MTQYKFRYSLGEPEARNDGSGQVAHDLQAQAAPYSTEDWVTLRHKTVLLPALELSALLATGTTAQKGAAYKQLIAANLNTQAEPVDGWSTAQLQLLLDGNEASVAAAAASVNFVTNTLGATFPVTFVM